MNPIEYVQAAIRTESRIDPELRFNQLPTDFIRLLHAAMGLCTEAGEFQDELKRVLFYHKELDRINLIEEIGDVCWYLAVLCDTLEVSLEDVMARNIAKLKQRYPEKFASGLALNRNLYKEREALQDNA